MEQELTNLPIGPVKLMKRVKIAHSFLQSVSNQFHFNILSLPNECITFYSCQRRFRKLLLKMEK